MPDATFYIWLNIFDRSIKRDFKDELEFTQKLYEEKHIKVLPGSFLGREGVGKGYVRIALVEQPEKTKEVLERLKGFQG